ncbi:MAG: 1-acyl-sn-glycerol-3-phosphate acyltransferase [Acholeplasmataceae bacterium]|nr:1-acyl-sn-glycerol-3-phosphate acyltransferase [Acholeplasmataceae bacterium]
MKQLKNNLPENQTTESEHTFQTIKARPVELKENYDYFSRKWYKRFFSSIVIFIIRPLIRYLWAPFFLGFKVKNKKLLKSYRKSQEKGFIFVSNHLHPIDAFLAGTVIWPKKSYFTMLMTNLGIPFAGKWLKLLGGAPIPNKRSYLVEFQQQLNSVIDKGAWVGVYPETSLRPYSDQIRPFKKGAFRFAIDSNVDIIPMVFVLKKPYGVYRLYKRKPLIQLHILERYKIDDKGSKSETLAYHSKNLQNIMSAYFEKHQTIKE